MLDGLPAKGSEWALQHLKLARHAKIVFEFTRHQLMTNMNVAQRDGPTPTYVYLLYAPVVSLYSNTTLDSTAPFTSSTTIHVFDNYTTIHCSTTTPPFTVRQLHHHS